MVLQQPAYPVHIHASIAEVFGAWLQERSYDQVFILCDAHTEASCYPLIADVLPDHVCITIPPGEENKNIYTCLAIWEELSNNLATRNSILINLGGGVIGDMGGFSAATFKRGFDFVQMPTTLLSQVDASVGGKLGIDLQGFKNLIGIFCDPAAVFIGTDFLQTLPTRQLRSGFAEVLKHGLIRDAAYWKQVSVIQLNTTYPWTDIIAHSVRIKSDVVQLDPKESGLRKVLNFGHTIGHAVETWSLRHDADPLLHGEAIAVGIICEAALSSAMLGLTNGELEEITNACMGHFEHYPLDRIDPEELLLITRQDKKNRYGLIQFSLLKSIGDCTFDIAVSDASIREALTFYNGLSCR